jgi:cobalt/nickel transport system permease protein
MHLSDGILTETVAGTIVLATTTGLAAVGTAIGLRTLDYERVPRAAVLSAAFFVASLVHLRLGITSIHLLLHGLVGIILGWATFPALLIALTLQAVFFGHGGITVLGVNTFNFGSCALLSYYLFHRLIRRSGSHRTAFVFGFLAGMVPVILSALLIVAELMLTGGEFESLAAAVLFAHLPLAAVEGLITGFTVAFLRRVRPELLESPMLQNQG